MSSVEFEQDKVAYEPVSIAAGGWCAPSDTIYPRADVAGNVPVSLETFCPQWCAEPDEGCGSEHSCVDESEREHFMCVCEFCDATRIVQAGRYVRELPPRDVQRAMIPLPEITASRGGLEAVFGGKA